MTGALSEEQRDAIIKAHLEREQKIRRELDSQKEKQLTALRARLEKRKQAQLMELRQRQDREKIEVRELHIVGYVDDIFY